MLLLVVALVNTPVLMSLATNARVSSNGEDGTAEVVGRRVYGDQSSPQYWITYRFDEKVDPDREAYSAEVDRATYARVDETREIGVRVVPGDPAAHRVDGAEPRRLGLVITLVADALVAAALLIRWLRRRGRPEPDSEPVPQSEP